MKKRGKKINNHVAILPFGVKRPAYEMDARIAMLAIERGQCNEQHIVDLYILADLCERLNNDAARYISTHSASVKKLAEAIHNKTCDGLASTSIVASSGILLDWIHKQNNKRVFDTAMEQLNKLNKQPIDKRLNNL